MDRIIESLLQQFCEEHGFASLKQDKQFEHLASYLVINRFHSDTFNIPDVIVGDSNDTAIDGIAIVVNGALVTDPEAVDEFAERNKFLDVTFIFVQAERSPGFSSQKIGEVGFGVADFFKDKPQLPRNESVENAASVMSAIYQRSALFTKGNPNCRIFYVTTGKWLNDPQLETRRAGVVSDLEETGMFREVEFTPVGASEVQKLYRQTQNAISREFTFTAKTVIPEIAGVSEAYLGFLPASEFLSLIQDECGNLIRSIFYDNVRDWQDYNVVNTGIKESVQSESLRGRFVLMNNGITIIAKELRATGNRFSIQDYQIVNGCQTSHVLYDQRDKLDRTVMVPVRVIATQDEEVIGSIIKATNRQTQVKEEQLLALSDFQKKLEEYFLSFDNGKKLYYERRSRQYNSVTSIEKTRVITMSNLIRAFAAIFRNAPHQTTRGFGSLLEQVGKQIFGPDHRLEPYYLSALALYRLEFLFRNQTLEPKYKPARYHLLYAFRLISTDAKMPHFGSHEMERYCKPLLQLLWDSVQAEKVFRKAATAVDAVAKGNFHRDHIRTREFTEYLEKHCTPARAAGVP